MQENTYSITRDLVNEFNDKTLAKKYSIIMDLLSSKEDQDDLVQIFRIMLLDDELCSKIVTNDFKIQDFYNKIIKIIKEN